MPRPITTRLTTRTAVPALTALTALLAAAALAGCGSGGAHPSASPSSMTDAQILAISHQYSRCMRNHGWSDFPGMVLVDGQLKPPNTNPPGAFKEEMKAHQGAVDACKSILERLPASGQHSAGPTAAELRADRRFARCMRGHGIADFPDPDSSGNFTLPPSLQQNNESPSPRLLAAAQACVKYLPEDSSVRRNIEARN